jgi:hypothetical protein
MPHMLAASPRPTFYKYLRESDSLDSYVHEEMRVRLARRRAEMLDERNIQSYRHGNRWALEASTDSVSEMHSMAAESTIHNVDIINHETAILEKYMETMVEQLYGALVKHLFETAGEAAESVGNTIGRDDHGGNIPAGFLAMLEKIEFGVDRYGRAQRPTMHVSPSTGKTFIESLQSQPIEYHLKVEMISEKKEKKAIAREAERISKFRWQRQ